MFKSPDECLKAAERGKEYVVQASVTGALIYWAMANTAGQWHTLMIGYGQHRRPVARSNRLLSGQHRRPTTRTPC